MNENGSITFWLLGLSLLLVAVGGIGLDLWRALEVRRDLSSMADAASAAAVSAIDEAHWRAVGELRLEPSAAEERALMALRAQPGFPALLDPPIVEVVDGTAVFVRLDRDVELTLLRLFAGGRALEVSAESVAYAVVRR